MAERKIPNSIEAEKAVLGSAFLSKTALQKICDEWIPLYLAQSYFKNILLAPQ